MSSWWSKEDALIIMPRRVASTESEESSGSEAPIIAKKQVPKKRGRPSKKKQNSDDDEEDDDDAPAATQGKGKGKGGKAASKLSDSDVQKKARDLVRLALCNELSRKPLKREDVNKHLGIPPRGTTDSVIKAAQSMLARSFGLELIELRGKGTGLASKTAVGQELDSDDAGKERSGGTKKKSAAPKSYILRSKLKAEWLAAAADSMTVDMPDEDDEDVDLRMFKDDREGEGLGKSTMTEESTLREWRRDGSTLFDWKRSDQLPHAGLLHIILGLILVNSRRCADDTLRVYLKRLKLTSTTTLPSNPSMTLHSSNKPTIDKLLTLYTQQGYLEKVSNKRMAKGQQPKAADNEGSALGDPAQDWLWGPRADAEIGEEAVSEFMIDFLKPPRDATTAKAKEEFRAKKEKDITKAAGSALLEAREDD